MKNSEKGFTTLSGILTVAGAGLVLVGGLVYDAGAVRVSVHEKRPGGDSIRIIAPAAIVPVVMAFVPDRVLRKDLPPEARNALPVLKIAAEELRKLPDCTLVEVHGPGEDVSIALKDGTLAIDVDSEDEEVHVQVPLGVVESVASRIVSAGESSS
jgi:hypothetical protein